jgi:hypothetical protein
MGFAAGATGSNQSSVDEIRLGNSFASVTPDAGMLSFASASSEATEAASASIVAVTIQRTGGFSGPISVTCASDLAGTAVAGTHYTPSLATLSWADGEASGKTFLLNLLAPASADGDVTIHLSLNSPVGGAVLGTPSGATLLVHDSIFDQWRTTFFGGDVATAGGVAEADFDGDGVPNLMEYAFGGNPILPQGPTIACAVEGGYLTLTVNRLSVMPSDVSWRAEVSSDLVDWQSGPSLTSTLIDNASTLKVRDNAPSTDGTRRFLRLRLSRP